MSGLLQSSSSLSNAIKTALGDRTKGQIYRRIYLSFSLSFTLSFFLLTRPLFLSPSLYLVFMLVSVCLSHCIPLLSRSPALPQLSLLSVPQHWFEVMQNTRNSIAICLPLHPPLVHTIFLWILLSLKRQRCPRSIISHLVPSYHLVLALHRSFYLW